MLTDPVSLLALMELPGIGRKKAARMAADGDVPVDSDRWDEIRARVEKAIATLTAVSLFDDGYPEHLKDLADPPLVLLIKGEMGALQMRQVAVVGSRSPAPEGIEAVQQIVPTLARDGLGIVSGLAAGIDTAGHREALRNDTGTVAVLPSGFNRVFPSENRGLAGQIENRGALITEYLPDCGPEKYRFIERDRIQAGLAEALIVADTGLAGGTMHTVRFAAELGRPVFCPASSRSAGVKALLETPACDLWKILPAWKSKRKLCERLGRKPLARPFDGPDELLFQLT